MKWVTRGLASLVARTGGVTRVRGLLLAARILADGGVGRLHRSCTPVTLEVGVDRKALKLIQEASVVGRIHLQQPR